MGTLVFTANILKINLEISYSQVEPPSDFVSLLLFHHFQTKLKNIKWKEKHLLVA